MISTHETNSRSFRPNLEVLEDRCTPAIFGLPWPDAARLTVSFAPDGTAIAGHASNLNSALDVRLGRDAWQGAILRAMQTWAAGANINFGVVADGGQAFGTSGDVQGDMRFGDLRVGGQAMTDEAFSVSVPYDPFISGTWAGDLLVNTHAPLNTQTLYRVALHEVGHALGLSPSSDPLSPMYNRLGSVDQPTAADIDNLRRLYGPRLPDVHEGKLGNNTPATATKLDLSLSNNGRLPLVAFGDLAGRDLDHFSLKSMANYTGPATISVRTAGLSLLAASLTVLDQKGRIVAQASATRPGEDVTLRLMRLDPSERYTLRVAGARADVFSVGRFALVTRFDSLNRVSEAKLNQAIRSAPSGLAADDIKELLTESIDDDLWEEDGGKDDTSAKARKLEAVVSNGGARFSAIGSIARPGEMDFYRIDLPNTAAALSITLRAGAVNGVVPSLAVLDARGRVVSSEVLVNDGSTLTVLVPAARAGQQYTLRVVGNRAGNYTLSSLWGVAPAARTTFATGTVPASYAFFVAQTQLFALSLNAKGSAGVRMEIRDDRGALILALAARPGETVTAGSLLLRPGAYRVSFQREGTGTLEYALRGASLSDPIGPVMLDPTLTPQYLSPSDPGIFLYPGGVVSQSPFFWVLLAPDGTLLLPGFGPGFPIL